MATTKVGDILKALRPETGDTIDKESYNFYYKSCLRSKGFR